MHVREPSRGGTLPNGMWAGSPRASPVHRTGSSHLWHSAQCPIFWPDGRGGWLPPIGQAQIPLLRIASAPLRNFDIPCRKNRSRRRRPWLAEIPPALAHWGRSSIRVRGSCLELAGHFRRIGPKRIPLRWPGGPGVLPSATHAFRPSEYVECLMPKPESPWGQEEAPVGHLHLSCETCGCFSLWRQTPSKPRRLHRHSLCERMPWREACRHGPKHKWGDQQ